MSGRALEAWRIVVAAVRHFLEDDGLNRSAAIAFYGIVSLGPALYLLGRVIEGFFPVSDALGAAAERIAAFLPPDLAPLAERLPRSLRVTEGLVALALPGLLWVALSAFTALHRAVEVAFRPERPRRFWVVQGKILVTGMGAAGLLVGSAAAGQVVSWLERFRERMELPPILGPGATWATASITLLVTWIGFFALYRFLPRVRVGWKAAGLAAVTAVALWEAARNLFGAALVRLPTLGLLTGTLAGIVAFLFWIYTASAICVFGAELAAVLNGNRPTADDR